MDTLVWVSQSVAASALSTSVRTLSRMRVDSTLPQGRCWRRKIPHNPNSHVIYNLEACIDVLNGQARAAQIEQDRLSKITETEVSQA